MHVHFHQMIVLNESGSHTFYRTPVKLFCEKSWNQNDRLDIKVQNKKSLAPVYTKKLELEITETRNRWTE